MQASREAKEATERHSFMAVFRLMTSISSESSVCKSGFRELLVILAMDVSIEWYASRVKVDTSCVERGIKSEKAMVSTRWPKVSHS
jgi:hypothetical protein